ncbi:MAG TPA: hypothetical protein DEQ20_10460 [Desulfobulbaceae bacterium]|nr:hypothetical protein [Desulfobulbaceae bacterium]
MIPVTLQPEPSDFDQRVRQPGRNWLTAQGIALNMAPPKASAPPNYWTHSNRQLWESYSGVCAYLAIFFEWVTGAASTDHFVAKSRHAGDAYEWNNYRLSCLAPNRNKNKFDDVLDPIGLAADTFVLNLASGEITPNPSLDAVQKNAARKTIRRLRLDSPDHNAMRAKHFYRYIRGKDEQSLRELSPFVWYEAQRQGQL